MKKAGYVMALMVAAAAGYCLHPTAKAPEGRAEEPVAKRRPQTVADSNSAALVKSLRERVKELEAQLAARGQSAQTEVPDAEVQEEERPDRQPRHRDGMRERMEELKLKDPERFAKITKRIEAMRAARKSRQEARASFLASVDTSELSDQDRQTHENYQTLMAQRENLEEQMHQQDLTDEARRGLMEEMREVDQQMRELGESERKMLLGEVAMAVGLEGEAVEEMVQTVSDVVEATETHGGPYGPPPGDAPPEGKD